MFIVIFFILTDQRLSIYVIHTCQSRKRCSYPLNGTTPHHFARLHYALSMLRDLNFIRQAKVAFENFRRRFAPHNQFNKVTATIFDHFIIPRTPIRSTVDFFSMPQRQRAARQFRAVITIHFISQNPLCNCSF